MDADRRPLFARDFPRGGALDALVDAFAEGNYARVRADGTKLAESANDDAVRRAALMLVARTKPDPLAVWLLVVAGALLMALSVYWIANGKPPPGSGPRPPGVQRTG
jgi:hypothetical protein